MKLWLISQRVNNGYDTYDSAVVVAETGEYAKKIHPSSGDIYGVDNVVTYSGGQTYDRNPWNSSYGCWAREPNQVDVECIGEAADDLKEGDIIVASFNAG